MKINRDNYEQYFLDYAEGNLSPDMERELKLFLEANPALRAVLENFDSSPLPVAEIKNDTLKERLKKNIHPTVHINETNVDEWLIRETEGLLSASENSELEEFLSLNPAYEYDRKLFSMTRSEPDPAVVFPRKNQLKKRIPVFSIGRIAWISSAAAAMILLVIGIRYFNQPAIIDNPQVIPVKTRPIAEVPAAIPSEIGIGSLRTSSLGTPSQATPSLSAVTLRVAPYRMAPNDAPGVVVQRSVNLLFTNEVAYNPATITWQEEKSDKSLIAKVFGNMVLKARNAFNVNPDLEKVRNVDVNIWSLAEAGVKGFNTVTDRDLELLVRRNEEGKIKSYALVEEDRLFITKNRDKN
jgi:hypothetical protein